MPLWIKEPKVPEKQAEQDQARENVKQTNEKVKGEEDEENSEEEFSDSDTALALVSNIPPTFHSADLRRHFTDWVEAGSFLTFHFRHRPEKGQCILFDCLPVCLFI